jgi:cobalt-zinc-cadmium efflux system membrane fusion protein
MRPTASFTILVLLAFGCGRREEPAARETAGAEGKAGQQAHGADDQHGAEDAGGVHIDHEMLRDLRITTAAVETRPGAEAAPVLGELRVPDPAYAEVGSPVTARALRVAVTAGETVKRGQLLAELQSLDLGKTRGEHQQALARAELARQAVERKRGLAEERIVPLREVQEAEAELRSA